MGWLVGIVMMVQGHFGLEWKYFGVSEQFCEVIVFVWLNLDCPRYFSKKFFVPSISDKIVGYPCFCDFLALGVLGCR